MNIKKISNYSRRGLLSLIAMGAVTFTSLGPSVSSYAMDPPAFTQPANIPDATRITVILRADEKSGEAKEGDPVPFIVKDDVRGPNGDLWIKAGTPAFGHIVKSSHRGFLGKPGKLEFTCDYVAFPDGSRLPLRSDEKTKYGEDNRAVDVAAAVLITPVALLIRGKDTTARTGQEFTLFVNQHRFDTGTASSALMPAGKNAFLLNDGTTIVGFIDNYDGRTYVVSTESGVRNIHTGDVKSISPVQ